MLWRADYGLFERCRFALGTTLERFYVIVLVSYCGVIQTD